MDRVTPAVLYGLYADMSDDDQNAFLKLLGADATAEAPFVMASALGLIEAGRFTELIGQEIMARLLPLLVQSAREAARGNPGLPDDEFDRLLREQVGRTLAEYDAKISELEGAKLKQQRDRKNDPEMVRRNVEICERRKDRKQWSLKKLARHYHTSVRNITLIVKDEAKWRRLAAGLRSN